MQSKLTDNAAAAAARNGPPLPEAKFRHVQGPPGIPELSSNEAASER